jgi:hypothetical protein
MNHGHDSTLSHVRLITPFYQRPELPSGELALAMARVRECTERWMTPIPDEAPASPCRPGPRSATGRQVGRPRSVTPEQEADIIGLREAGWKIGEIADEAKCTEGAVRHVLLRWRDEA